MQPFTVGYDEIPEWFNQGVPSQKRVPGHYPPQANASGGYRPQNQQVARGYQPQNQVEMDDVMYIMRMRQCNSMCLFLW